MDPSDPQVFYAAVNSRGMSVYKSRDGGVTWQPASQGLPETEVVGLAMSRDTPPRLYAATQEDGELYVSRDGAQSWTRAGANPNWCCNFGRQLFVSPADGNVVFGLQIGGGAIASVSRDGGQNWQLLQDQRGPLAAVSLAIDPANPQVVYAGTEANGVFKSSDGGVTWTAANKGMLDYRISALAVDPLNPQTVYAGGEQGELFKSTDGAQSWQDFSAKLKEQLSSYLGRVVGLLLDPAAPGTLYLLARDVGLLVGQVGGERWQMLGKPGEWESAGLTTWLLRLAPQPILIVAADDHGAWRQAANSPVP
jgi:photosystem II stability/assembly factor-like uncharacterized protein